MPSFISGNFPHDYNCYSGAYSTDPEQQLTYKGSQGVTIWGPVDLPSTIAHGGGVSPNLLFTPTIPKCYDGPDFCNVTFRIHAEGSSENDIGPIHLTLWVRTYPLPGWAPISYTPYYISGVAGHDARLTIDVEPIEGYDETRQMYLTFTNDDPGVDVSIKELQIVRGYGMKSLEPAQQEECSGDQTQDGSYDFATRHDYPCNYEKCGGLSYTGFNRDDHHYTGGAGTILFPENEPPGNPHVYTWEWENPTATFNGYNTYVGPLHCFFNFNNVMLCDDNGNVGPDLTASTNDIPFLISLDNEHWETFYHCKGNNSNLPHGIDLATHPYLKQFYNDNPGGSNTLYLKIPDPNPGVNLILLDGDPPTQHGFVNLYRVYKTKPCCPTISTATTGSGTISPSGGPFPIPEQGKTFDMTASGGSSLNDVEIDDTSKGPVDPYNVEWDDINLNLGMEGHEIHAYFSHSDHTDNPFINLPPPHYNIPHTNYEDHTDHSDSTHQDFSDHSDAHSDTGYNDAYYPDYTDTHSNFSNHSDTGHQDFSNHSDTHANTGYNDAYYPDHTDTHSNFSDHTDLPYTDHSDSHSDTGYSDAYHEDHANTHGDFSDHSDAAYTDWTNHSDVPHTNYY
jgi:hypothetical protein